MFNFKILEYTTYSILPQQLKNKKGFRKGILIFISLFTFLPQSALSVSFVGFLGDEYDASEYDYPRYVDYKKFKLDPTRIYTCTAWSESFIPELLIEDMDITTHIRSTPRSTDKDIFKNRNGIYGTKVTFQPMYNSHQTYISITSKKDPTGREIRKGRYKIICNNKPAKTTLSPMPRPRQTPAPTPIQSTCQNSPQVSSVIHGTLYSTYSSWGAGPVRCFAPGDSKDECNKPNWCKNLGKPCKKCPPGFNEAQYRGSISCVRCPPGMSYNNDCCN